MYKAFELLPKSSRLWIYQSDKSLGEEKTEKTQRVLENFLKTWQVHNKDIQAGCQIAKQRFILLAVNEEINAPSGCSLDKLSAIIGDIEEHLDVELLNRTLLSFYINDEIQTVDLKEIAQKVADGTITDKTLFFDTTISTMEVFQKQWPIPAGETWLKRYFSSIK